MIDDRMEEGRSEHEAVSDIGSVEEIAAQIVSEIPLAKFATQRLKPKRNLRAGEVVLLILGSPIWLSLVVAAFAVMLALYAVLWSLILCLYAVELSLAATGVMGAFLFVFYLAGQSLPAALLVLGAGLVSAGLVFPMHVASVRGTKGMVVLGKRIFLCIKGCFVRKRG
jgi:uncharacterized membrane protein